MMALFYGLVALQLMQVHAVQATFDGEGIAATLQSTLQSASRSLRHQLSELKTQHSRLSRRRLTTTDNATGPCTIFNGSCTLADTWALDLASNLPAASEARTFFEDWVVCSVKSFTECNATQTCYWDLGENECTPVVEVNIQGMDWLNFTGCGILSSADAAARCEAQTNCAAVPSCTASQAPFYGIGSSGMCESQTRCEYQGDMFLSACGAEFNIETIMGGCMQQVVVGHEVQNVTDCIVEACPAQADFFSSFISTMFSCMALDETACGNTASCQYNATGASCDPYMNMVLQDAIPATCALKDFFVTGFECDSAVGPGGCDAAANCHLETSMVCSAQGVAPTSMTSCSPRDEVLFAQLQAATCDDAVAQFYTKGVLQHSQCVAATSATCAAVTEVVSECPTTVTSTTAGQTAVDHATGLLPSCVTVLFAALILLKELA
mmetsp:Transcript_17042/g.39781  ORF Transcript_17042/g.39781 Transcript_17042/m.39781 type:complete len:438 (-) Transcript_17042:123-1436(-)